MSVIYLRPASTNTDPGPLFLKTGGATVSDCIDDQVGAPDDATTMVSHTTIPYWVTPETMPASISIASVQLFTRMRERGGGVNSSFTPAIRIGGVTYAGATYGPVASNLWIEQTDTYLLNPSTGLAWTTAGVNSIIFGGSGVIVADEMDITQQYLVVDFVPSSVRLGDARDNGSRLMRLFRRAVGTVELRAPLRFGDAELLDDITVTHFALPTTHDYGAGAKVWQRAILRKLSEELDLATLTVKMRCLVLRDFLCLFWDTMISEQPPGLSDGISRLDCGAGRLFTRASKAWVENAATALQGTKQVVEVTTNGEKHTTDGELFEAASTNSQIQSSFASALTGWTAAGTGSNGSAIAADATDLLFDSVVSANSIKFTAGSPIHVADLQITGTASAAIAASSIVSVSVDHKDDSGSPLYFAVQRGVDSKYVKTDGVNWQAGKVWHAMTTSLTPARYAFVQIDVGTSSTTLTVLVGVPTASGVAGQINHLYHVQVEVYPYPTSRIVTAAAAVTRAADSLTIENFHGKRVWMNERGYAHLVFIPEWNSADVTGVSRFLWSAFYDANNSFKLFYSGGTSFKVRTRIAGVVVDTAVTQAVVRGGTYEIGFRWTGADGEEDLTPYTLSIFCNGVKGTDAVYAGPMPTMTSAPFLTIGSAEGAVNHCDGWIRHFVVGQAVFSDEEIADLP